jgi:hypothetical protein
MCKLPDNKGAQHQINRNIAFIIYSSITSTSAGSLLYQNKVKNLREKLNMQMQRQPALQLRAFSLNAQKNK